MKIVLTIFVLGLAVFVIKDLLTKDKPSKNLSGTGTVDDSSNNNQDTPYKN